MMDIAALAMRLLLATVTQTMPWRDGPLFPARGLEGDDAVDIGEVRATALGAVQAGVASIRRRSRPLDEGATQDKALWSEVRELALAAIGEAVAFDIRKVGSYFRDFPELAAAPARRGNLADAIKTGLCEILFEGMRPELEELHSAQFDRSSPADVKVWGKLGMDLVRSHGDAVSGNMRQRVDNLDEGNSLGELAELEETLGYIADRVEAHSVYQRGGSGGQMEHYETVARRLRETCELVRVLGDRLEAEDRNAPAHRPGI